MHLEYLQNKQNWFYGIPIATLYMYFVLKSYDYFNKKHNDSNIFWSSSPHRKSKYDFQTEQRLKESYTRNKFIPLLVIGVISIIAALYASNYKNGLYTSVDLLVLL